MTDRTTITVSDDVWRYLDAKKQRGQSFDELLRDEFGIEDRHDQGEIEA